MEITVPTQADFAELMEIAMQVHALHVQLRPDIFTPEDMPLTKTVFEENRGKGQLLIAWENGSILGYALFHLAERQAADSTLIRRWLWVDVLGTREDVRGQGVGSTLMEHLRQIGRAEECGRLALTVTSENEGAIRFYENIGMRAENIRYSIDL